MAEKWTTAAQLKKLALLCKADSAARIAELADLVVVGLESVQHDIVTVTLPASKWSGGAQIIDNDIFRADSSKCYFVCGDAGCCAEYGDAGVRADNITQSGQATFRCEIPPEIDLTVHIIRLEVETK